MKIIRGILQLAVLLLIYSIAAVIYMHPDKWPYWAIAAVVIMVKLRPKGELYSHGTARFATIEDVKHMLGGRGIILGYIGGRLNRLKAIGWLFSRYVPNRAACEQFIGATQHKAPVPLVRLNAVHTAIFAPTGAGKGVSFVVPWLMTNPDNAVVVDFKGENAALTAAHRRKKFGHKIVLLNPFNHCALPGEALHGWPVDSLNPLDFIDPNHPLAPDDCRELANSLILRTSGEKDPFWDDMAEMNAATMVAATLHYAKEGERSLQAVKDVASNAALRKQLLEKMQGSDAWDGMLARMGHAVSHSVDKELGGILSATNRHLKFLDTLAVARSTAKSTFDPSIICKQRSTIYLIIPLEHIETQSALLRLWIGSLLRSVIRNGLQEHRLIHFLTDEANALGSMQQIKNALTIGRGYGLRLQLIYQDLGQLKRCWPDGADQTLLANTSQIFFAVNDLDTANYVSNRLGDYTMTLHSGNRSRGSSTSHQRDGSVSESTSDNVTTSWSSHGRRLMRAEEVLNAHPRTAFTFTPGKPPICTTLIRWFELDFRKAIKSRFWRTAGDAIGLLLLSAAIAGFATYFLLKQKGIDVSKFNLSQEQKIIQQVRGDMSPEQIAATGRITESPEQGALSAIKAGFGRAFREIGEELGHQLEHGAHELASALMTGQAYVQYARGEEVDDPQHGLPEEAQGHER